MIKLGKVTEVDARVKWRNGDHHHCLAREDKRDAKSNRGKGNVYICLNMLNISKSLLGDSIQE